MVYDDLFLIGRIHDFIYVHIMPGRVSDPITFLYSDPNSVGQIRCQKINLVRLICNVHYRKNMIIIHNIVKLISAAIICTTFNHVLVRIV